MTHLITGVLRLGSLLLLLTHLGLAFLAVPSLPLREGPTKERSHDSLLQQRKSLGRHWKLGTAAFNTDTAANDGTLDVVLFGVGDLRVDDHVGLATALRTDDRILPLVILDDATLANIPGAAAHTTDTANMIEAAVADLQSTLKEEFELDLQIIFDKRSISDAFKTIIKQLTGMSVRVHVQDLGDADNVIGYGPFSQLAAGTADLSPNIEVVPWTCHLRDDPWEKVNSLPDRYPDYVKSLPQQSTAVPLTVKRPDFEMAQVSLDEGKVLNAAELVSRIQTVLELDPSHIEAEVNTGIFHSHWGGLDAVSVGESQVLKNLNVFVSECLEVDDEWVQQSSYPGKKCSRNPRSLEHATFDWFLENKNGSIGTKNLLAGEPMTRYLSAPLLIGTISPRRLWHMSKRAYIQFNSPLKTLVEGHEWHKLLAAKNIRTLPEYQANNCAEEGLTSYGYWRWHGFLCRYTRTALKKNPSTASKKEGVLFFHGFGASGAQWNKAMNELSSCLSDEEGTTKSQVEGLAPDLLGFGQAEKPPLSYSIYVWDTQCSDFIKEVATSPKKNAWDSYIVGGNSIGGFSAASTAANDHTTAEGASVSSSGAPGTRKCQGVVLMNPAGPIQSREEVEALATQSSSTGFVQKTVAQLTATDALSECKPPPRPVARLFGNGLLSYLRPNIQSICVNLYPTNPSAVDDNLCVSIERDSLDPGAVGVMISGAKLPPPRTMNEMLQADYGGANPVTGNGPEEATFSGPVLVTTGVLDPLNDAKGRSIGLQALRSGIVFDSINAGHCPHDELPKDVATSIAKWMSSLTRTANLANRKVAS